ncbi:hypothetical protein DPMN_020525 [Dreissena polymorpha]|uniref:Uncharacterized protein n=1 Tax=Dreissena polymorpha TaxID=45954 RepID=A0A9D4NMA8_DREPO|nr:hypothetical protein DPMN_020525 [Dreissena polymorpha]
MGTREATAYGSFITEKFLREISFIKIVPIGVEASASEYRKKLPFVNAAPIEEIEAKKLKAAGGKEKKSGRYRHRR